MVGHCHTDALTPRPVVAPGWRPGGGRSAVAGQLGPGLCALVARFFRQSEDALADDVALHLVGPAVDRRRLGEQRHLGDVCDARLAGGGVEFVALPGRRSRATCRAGRGSARPRSRPVRTRSLIASLPRLPTPGSSPPRARSALARRFVKRAISVSVCNRINCWRIEGSPSLPCARARSVNSCSAPATMTPAPPLPGLRARHEVARPLRQIASDGAGEGERGVALAAGAEALTLERQRRVGHGPAVVRAADDPRVRHACVGQEHLVEKGPAGHLTQWADVDRAVLVHVEREPRDALVLRRVRVRAGDEHAHVGDLAARRPDLLPVDDPLVAVADGSACRDRRGPSPHPAR